MQVLRAKKQVSLKAHFNYYIETGKVNVFK